MSPVDPINFTEKKDNVDVFLHYKATDREVCFCVSLRTMYFVGKGELI